MINLKFLLKKIEAEGRCSLTPEKLYPNHSKDDALAEFQRDAAFAEETKEQGLIKSYKSHPLSDHTNRVNHFCAEGLTAKGFRALDEINKPV